jgi:uncharacterized protein (DUF169 family)
MITVLDKNEKICCKSATERYLMKPIRTDFSVYNKLGFEILPVGVKYLFFRPQGIKQLSTEKNLSFCEMLTEAQQTKNPFYFSKENNETCVGKILLGMEEMVPFAETGQIGARLEIFQEPRANYAFYKYVPRFAKGTVNYVAFSTIEKLVFEPDVLIITATPKQAEIVMRSMTYSTGELYVSKTTPVMGCAWFYIYPFQTGNVNYLIPEMVHGMKGRELFAEGMILISIPYQWIPIMTHNLQEMKIHLPSHTGGKEQYLAELGKIFGELANESENP